MFIFFYLCLLLDFEYFLLPDSNVLFFLTEVIITPVLFSTVSIASKMFSYIFTRVLLLTVFVSTVMANETSRVVTYRINRQIKIIATA